MVSPSPNQFGNPPMLQQQRQCISSNCNIGGGQRHCHNCSGTGGGRRHCHNRGGNGGNGNYGVHYYRVESRDWYACSYANGWEYAAPVPMPLLTPNGYYYGNSIIPPPRQGTLFLII